VMEFGSPAMGIRSGGINSPANCLSQPTNLQANSARSLNLFVRYPTTITLTPCTDMPKPIELSAVFGLEPESIVQAFEAKGYTFSWDWTDTWQEAHAKSFTVAKVMKLDLLQDIQDGIQAAIKTGRTEAEFKKNLIPLLQAKGWWGRVPAKDVPSDVPLPKGVDPEKEVQLGSPRRLRTIYQTNLQVAYSVGRWKSMKENSAIRPYWGWVSLLDNRTRFSHRLLDYTVSGKVYPHDDPFWAKFYPPIDWGCRCRIRAFREDELKARGLTPSTGDKVIKIEKVPLKESDPGGAQVEVAVFLGGKQAVRTGKGWAYPKGEGYFPDLKKYEKPIRVEFEKAVKKEKADNFPESLADVKYVKNLGGSTGAALYEDIKGRQFVLKKGASAKHLLEEAQADRLYQELGFAVPEFKVFETEEGPVKLARFIKGKHLSELDPDSKEYKSALKQLKSGFAADAFLSNWDVVGLNLDNVLIDSTGKVFRIDNGGALRFRAMGKPKSQFDEYPDEFWTLRDQETNGQTAGIFKDLEFGDIMSQAQKVIGKRKELLAAISDKELRTLISKRLDSLENLSAVYKTFSEDQWKDEYTEEFLKHLNGIRKAGISARYPKSLLQSDPGKNYILYDEKNDVWDHLRGTRSIISDVESFINKNGGKYRIISDWMAAQAGSSNSEQTYRFGWYLASQRKPAIESYYWQNASETLKSRYSEFFKTHDFDVFKKSVSMYHAFTYDLLTKVDFKLKGNGYIKLMRTESLDLMKGNGFKNGMKGLQMRRKVIESTSIYKKVVFGGTEITVMNVPTHRIFATYFCARDGNSTHTAFLKDSENEFVALLEGIKLDYDNEYHP